MYRPVVAVTLLRFFIIVLSNSFTTINYFTTTVFVAVRELNLRRSLQAPCRAVHGYAELVAWQQTDVDCSA